MIVDSSVWIAHLRGAIGAPVDRLRAALAGREPICMPDVVLMEVLQGARDARSLLRLEQALLSLPRLVPPDPRLLHRRAATLYARCRWSGFTPRSGNDCLIAWQAIEAREPLLHDDRDFVRMAAVEPTLGRWLLPAAGQG